MSHSLSSATAISPAKAIQTVWEHIAPLSLAGSWDNVGLLVEAPFPPQIATRASKASPTKILLTIDLTSPVCTEALSIPDLGAVISYHPCIFSGIKSITLQVPLQASLLRLSAKGISTFVPHTSLDCVGGGMTDYLCTAFTSNGSVSAYGGGKAGILRPHATVEGAGDGRVVTFEGEGVKVSEVVADIKKILGIDHVQLALPALSGSTSTDPLIKSIAICNGSGAGVFKGAADHVDCLWTGEMDHHSILAAVAKGQTVIICGHSNTERPYLKAVLKAQLQKQLDDSYPDLAFEVIVSEKDEEPFKTV